MGQVLFLQNTKPTAAGEKEKIWDDPKVSALSNWEAEALDHRSGLWLWECGIWLSFRCTLGKKVENEGSIVCVCVCVCVFQRERERERERN